VNIDTPSLFSERFGQGQTPLRRFRPRTRTFRERLHHHWTPPPCGFLLTASGFASLLVAGAARAAHYHWTPPSSGFLLTASGSASSSVASAARAAHYHWTTPPSGFLPPTGGFASLPVAGAARAVPPPLDHSAERFVPETTVPRAVRLTTGLLRRAVSRRDSTHRASGSTTTRLLRRSVRLDHHNVRPSQRHPTSMMLLYTQTQPNTQLHPTACLRRARRCRALAALTAAGELHVSWSRRWRRVSTRY